MSGVSKIRTGGGLTASVAFSREMNTSGTGVVGRGVTFGTKPVVFPEAGGAVGSGVAGTLVAFGTMPVVTSTPGGGVSRVSAKTKPGITRSRVHTTAMISRIPEVTSRTLCMEEPFVCSINIVTVVLKYGCFPTDCR